MKVIITKKDEFTSKKNGVKWVKLYTVDTTGATSFFLIEHSKFVEMNFDANRVLSSDDLSDIFKDFSSYEVSFNQFGRLVEVK